MSPRYEGSTIVTSAMCWAIRGDLIVRRVSRHTATVRPLKSIVCAGTTTTFPGVPWSSASNHGTGCGIRPMPSTGTSTVQ